MAMATVPGRVYSRFELINRGRGHEFEAYERTIDSHVKNLRRKIEEHPGSPQIVQTVLGDLYRLGLTLRRLTRAVCRGQCRAAAWPARDRPGEVHSICTAAAQWFHPPV